MFNTAVYRVWWNVAGVFWFSPSLGFGSYWPINAPRGRAVTRFPGTRQEEEKQNKPDRAAAACGLHWKVGLIISNTGTYTRSRTKRDVCGGVFKVSRTVSGPFCGSVCPLAGRCFCGRWISLEANGRSVVVVYRASAGMRKGADGGHTDSELRAKRKQKARQFRVKNHSVWRRSQRRCRVL